MSEDTEEGNVTEALAAIADRLDAMLRLVIGYRTKAVEAGFSEFSAEEMAVQVHAHLLDD